MSSYDEDFTQIIKEFVIEWMMEEFIDDMNLDVMNEAEQRQSLIARNKLYQSTWFESEAVNYPPAYFAIFFRMSKVLFESLASNLFEVRPHRPQKGRHPIALMKKLAIVVYRLGTLETVNGIAARFGVSSGSVVEYTDEVVELIATKLRGWIRLAECFVSLFCLTKR